MVKNELEFTPFKHVKQNYFMWVIPTKLIITQRYYAEFSPLIIDKISPFCNLLQQNSF